MNIEELEKQRDELDKQIKEYYKNKEIDNIERNKSYIGKTYYRELPNGEIRYYKILQIDPTNEYRMYTLSFRFPNINTGYGCMIKGEMYSMMNEHDLLEIENIGWFCNDLTKVVDSYSKFQKISKHIELYTEISEKEFEKAFNLFLKEITKIIFTN